MKLLFYSRAGPGAHNQEMGLPVPGTGPEVAVIGCSGPETHRGLSSPLPPRPLRLEGRAPNLKPR